MGQYNIFFLDFSNINFHIYYIIIDLYIVLKWHNIKKLA